ncbi:multidrug resistance efflux transporter family protein [Archangium violaceum]|uniref:DMT family transporter n=1 Tax=Archangium violaceum TaxID=83451 RepID=UPI00193B2628|nr:multidrug resistance efflux transporter family protein [Archangium violaceum]QRK12839.1 multidrug resistance efflux transporter family protein [Archangium violaceum]
MSVIPAILLGLGSAFFFTMTYVLNRSMVATGGLWAWSTSLRCFVMLPLLFVVVAMKGGWPPLWAELRRHPREWMLWGTVSFGGCYSFLALSAHHGPSWLIAGSFQISALAGPLLSPFIYTDERRRIPLKAVAMGSVIIMGVLLMQMGHFNLTMPANAWLVLLLVMIAAFSYPLGNRRLMLHLEREGVSLDAGQRVLGMTLGALPLWLAEAAHGYARVGWPSTAHVVQSAGVAVLAGVIGTTLFFRATHMAANNPLGLAAVEATQASELIFALVLGVLFLGEPWPSLVSFTGALLIVVGMVLYSRIGQSAELEPVEG